MILKIRARHFKDTFFSAYRNCAICKALKEHFPGKEVREHVSSTLIDEERWPHENYDALLFEEDAMQAKVHNYDDTVVRIININGLEVDTYPPLSSTTAEDLLKESVLAVVQ